MRRKNPFIYYGGKALAFVISVFLLSAAAFYVSRLAPGDPLVSYYGERAEKMTAAERAQRQSYEPDGPEEEEQRREQMDSAAREGEGVWCNLRWGRAVGHAWTRPGAPISAPYLDSI